MKKILFTGALFACFFAQAQSEADLTRETLSQSTIEGHIYFLAADELKGRETGSPEIDIAAEYLAAMFRRYRVQPVSGAEEGYFQSVELETVQPPSTKQIAVGEYQTDQIIVHSAYNTKTQMDVVYVNYGLAEDYKKKDVTGKLVVALAGQEGAVDPRTVFNQSGAKRELAEKMGAAGLVEITAFEDRIWNRFMNRYSNISTRIKEVDPSDFIHFWLRSANDELSNAVKKKKASANILIGGMLKTPMAAKNVVGMVEGTDPELKDEFIIYSAHYDHIGIGEPNAEGDSIYNGARDNAVGTVTVLSAAESIAKNPTKRSALFILFTAEEKGLLGSKWYAEHPLIPMKKMVYCFNSDNGGYNDKSVATIVGLERTTAGGHIKKACTEFGLEAIDDPAPEQGLFDRSDNVSFAVKGVPAPTFSLGFRAFDAEIGKYYHQTADNPDNLDYEYLTQFFGAYVMSCRLIANDSKTPFWVEGDKYYEAGKKLYDK